MQGIENAAEAEKAERHLERSINQARKLNDSAQHAADRLAEVKGRLVGYDNKKEPGLCDDGAVAPVQSECHELQDQLDGISRRLGVINSLISDIEWV